MVDQQIIDYIKKQIENGVPKEKIRDFLVSSGLENAIIEEAFTTVDSNVTDTPAETPVAATVNVEPNNNGTTVTSNEQPVEKPIQEIKPIGVKMPKKNLIVLIGIGVVLVIGIILVGFKFMMPPKNVVENLPEESQVTTNDTNENVVEDNNEETVVDETQTQPVVEEPVNQEPEIIPEVIIDVTLDTDNDGLTDINEAGYGTDINNPDTDGDGYKDGEEVLNGYNPNGEGKLNQ